jgi:anhydro-N-acetylmuramic acid kinase
MALFVGCMSGTSLDGVDAVLAQFEPDHPIRVLGHAWQPYPDALRRELLALNVRGENELHRASLAANAVAQAYADVVQELLDRTATDRAALTAIGAHGQTVRHQPQAGVGCGYTVQLLNGALLAELTQVDVVCDFRSRDVAAGGQGAPLVPAFHEAVFGEAGVHVAVLNVGGIANLTLLAPGAPVLGFDTGPGNLLMDLWAERHLGTRFDADGAWARSGRVLPSLLQAMQAEPFFGRAAPKSTGRDLFDANWLEGVLAHAGAEPLAQDVQATLAELTAWAVLEALQRDAPHARRLLVCGGGARNGHLMARLRAGLPGVSVEATDVRGVPADQVEALAFAWLAAAFVERRAGNLPAVTGARGTRVLGALHAGPPP